MSFWDKIFGKNKRVISKEDKKQVTKGDYFDIKSNVNGANIPVDQKSVILFVHGFGGEAVSTWKDTPIYLLEDETLKNWDIALFGYNSSLFPNLLKNIWVSVPDISSIARNVETVLKMLSDKGYNGISICAHSMGGLAVQKALIEMEPNDLAIIRNVFLFGTPSFGLKKAFLSLNDQVGDMSRNGKFIKKLREDWDLKFNGLLSFRLAVIAGDSDQFVPPESSQAPFPKQYWKNIGGDHLSMVKGTSPTHQAVEIIRTTILKDDLFNRGWNPFLVELQKREFHEAILKMPDLTNTPFQELEEDAQVQILLALDCTGNRQEALKLVEDMPEKNDKTDMMGKLGGIYKRMYLKDGLTKYYEKAYSFYEEAFKSSLLASPVNHSQAYYHAINLAFLQFNRKKFANAKDWAQKALDHVQQMSDGSNLWKLATIAEAQIYTGRKNEEIIKAYKEVLVYGPKLWERESMLINARKALEIKGLNNLNKQLEKLFRLDE